MGEDRQGALVRLHGKLVGRPWKPPLCAPISRVWGFGHLLPASDPAAPDLVLTLWVR